MYNIIWFKQQAPAKESMVFEPSSSLEWFIKCLNEEHPKENKNSLRYQKVKWVLILRESLVT